MEVKEYKPVKVVTEGEVAPVESVFHFNKESGMYEFIKEDTEVGEGYERTSKSKIALSPDYIQSKIDVEDFQTLDDKGVVIEKEIEKDVNPEEKEDTKVIVVQVPWISYPEWVFHRAWMNRFLF